MKMLTSKPYSQLGIFYVSTLITTLAQGHATPHPSTLLTTRAVTNTTKAGLAWPNGNSIDIEQYTSTGKVSWYVDIEFLECSSNIFHIQVLHVVTFPRNSQYRICPDVLGREVDRPMDVNGSENPSKFRTNHNGCFRDERVSRSLPNFRVFDYPKIHYRPDQNGQSNLTAQEGMDLWGTYMEPLHSMGYRLGSPAPSSAPSGKVWLQAFLAACGANCTVDFIALRESYAL